MQRLPPAWRRQTRRAFRDRAAPLGIRNGRRRRSGHAGTAPERCKVIAKLVANVIVKMIAKIIAKLFQT
jgi:hypothetical protein